MSKGSVLTSRKVKKIWAQNQLLTVQMATKGEGEEERKIKEKVVELEMQSKELKNQAVSVREWGGNAQGGGGVRGSGGKMWRNGGVAEVQGNMGRAC